jgi:hypothetical protein
MATTKLTASLPFVLLLFFAACSSKSSSSGTEAAGQEGVHAYCAAACDKAASCGPAVSGPDPAACTCEAKLMGKAFPLLRADVASAITQCASSLDCARLASQSDFASALDRCQRDAIQATMPSGAVEPLCSKLNAAAATCMQPMSDTCIDDFKPYNDGTLGAVSACFDKACGDVQACVEMALTP